MVKLVQSVPQCMAVQPFLTILQRSSLRWPRLKESPHLGLAELVSPCGEGVHEHLGLDLAALHLVRLEGADDQVVGVVGA